MGFGFYVMFAECGYGFGISDWLKYQVLILICHVWQEILFSSLVHYECQQRFSFVFTPKLFVLRLILDTKHIEMIHLAHKFFRNIIKVVDNSCSFVAGGWLIIRFQTPYEIQFLSSFAIWFLLYMGKVGLQSIERLAGRRFESYLRRYDLFRMKYLFRLFNYFVTFTDELFVCKSCLNNFIKKNLLTKFVSKGWALGWLLKFQFCRAYGNWWLLGARKPSKCVQALDIWSVGNFKL